jgi:hypothetical protein
MDDVVLAVIGLLATIAVPVAIHRATHPKRRVSYFLGVRPLHPVPQPPGPATARTSAPPGWPMQVTLQMWSSGRADVSSKNFDGDRPIVFQFGSPILEAHDADDEPTYLGVFEREGENRVLFRPAPIGGRRVFTIGLVVAEPVSFRVRHPLIDVEMVESRVPFQGARTTGGIRHLATNGMFWGVLQLVLSFVAMIVAFPAMDVAPSWGTALVLTYTVLFISGLLTIAISAIVRLTRWLTARAKQRRQGTASASST